MSKIYYWKRLLPGPTEDSGILRVWCWGAQPGYLKDFWCFQDHESLTKHRWLFDPSGEWKYDRRNC